MVDHASLTGAALHEPKGIDAAAANTVYIADGAGSGSWSTLTHSNLPSGSLVGFSNTQSSSLISGSTVMVIDDTIPQNTEGSEVLTVTHTPKASGNKLLIRFVGYMSTVNYGADYYYAAALFKDSTADALAATYGLSRSDVGHAGNIFLEHVYTTTGTSAITFKIRAGMSAGGSWAFNAQQFAVTRAFGGVSATSLSVQEFKA